MTIELNLEEKTIFSTNIIVGVLPSSFDIKAATDTVLTLRLDDKTGLKRSNSPTSWHSAIYSFENPEPNPNYNIEKLFNEYIMIIAQSVSARWGFGSVSQYSYWYNLNQKYSFNHTHWHPNCKIAGTFYLKVPDGSGNIKFLRSTAEIDRLSQCFPHDSNLAKTENAISYSHRPKAGDLLMFPGYLDHQVDQNLAEEDDDLRISVAFNIL
jgi:uncharacterized protein (TIGR02466 family)